VSELAKLQRAFQHALLEDDRAYIAPCVADEDEQHLVARLKIYERAYRSRLHAALESNYPLFARWVGADAFAQIAQHYVDTFPSRHFSIRYFGELLPKALTDTFEDRPWIAEFARWEWALGACFDAPDRNVLDPQMLARYPTEQWPSLRFELHPATQFFVARTNAPRIYKALTEDHEPMEAEMIAPCRWIIWRRDLVPCYRPLDIDEHDALQALQAGATFETLCTIISEHQAENTAARAAALLREWLNAHLLCDVHTLP
jgi:hypothetical protein